MIPVRVSYIYSLVNSLPKLSCRKIGVIWNTILWTFYHVRALKNYLTKNKRKNYKNKGPSLCFWNTSPCLIRKKVKFWKKNFGPKKCQGGSSGKKMWKNGDSGVSQPNWNILKMNLLRYPVHHIFQFWRILLAKCGICYFLLLTKSKRKNYKNKGPSLCFWNTSPCLIRKKVKFWKKNFWPEKMSRG